MLIFLLLSPSSIADTGPYDAGFVISPRDDAPTDSVLLYAANYAPTATALGGDKVEIGLSSDYITGVGATPRVAFLPPKTGWGVNQTWFLSVLGYYEEDGEVARFSFTTGGAPAPPPGEVVVGEITVGPWSDDTNYLWGCCAPVRTVNVAVSVQEADPWGWVEVVGAFDLGRPSQITTQEIHQHLVADVLPPGEHILEFVQWEDDRGPQPPCFDVVARSASGVPGQPQRYCTEDVDVEPDVTTWSCRSGSPAFGTFALVVPLLFSRRTRRTTTHAA